MSFEHKYTEDNYRALVPYVEIFFLISIEASDVTYYSLDCNVFFFVQSCTSKVEF